VAAAGQHKIKDWVTLFETGSSNRVRIDKTKLSLNANKPVIIAMRTRNNFFELGPGDKYWFPSIGDTTISFYHAMVVVGFDDGKGAFEVMNSWGETWGNKGFFWLKYDDYAKHVPNAYQMTLFSGGSAQQQTLIPKNDPRNLLAAKVKVRAPLRMENGKPVFQDIPFVWKNGIYELADQSTWPVGKRYQLVASNVSGGNYLYAFSIDNNNKINIHWPRDASLNDKFEGLNESAIISNERVELVIPSPETAMITEVSGAEYICLLLSKTPLSDLNTIVQTIKNNPTQPIKSRVLNALGKKAMAAGKVKNEAAEIAVSSSEKTGDVVAVLLRIGIE
jgi:hypothetical protein